MHTVNNLILIFIVKWSKTQQFLVTVQNNYYCATGTLEQVRPWLHQYFNKKGGVSINFSTLYLIMILWWSLSYMGGWNQSVEIKWSKWLLPGLNSYMEPFGRFLGNSKPAWSFIYYSIAIFWKNKLSSEVFALLVCKMAIFALLEVFPFSYLPHILEENKTMTATKAGICKL